MRARRLLAASLVSASLVAAAALPSCGEFTIRESCSDGLKNNGETDVDCGGSSCGKCALGKACAADHDCPVDTSCKGGFCEKKAIGIWKQITLTASPPARSGHGLVFNTAGKSLLLFGGAGAGGTFLGDTWTYAAGAWKSVVGKAPLPSARSGHALVADTSRVVVFGGTALDEKTMMPAFPTDTWAFTTAWAALTKVTAAPTGRSGAAVAFDAVRGEVVLYGGFATQELAETWTFKGDAWAERSPRQPAQPPALAQASMAFDEARKETVLFGGRVASEPPDISSKTWIWNGTDWTARDTTVGPTARYAAVMAYDSVRQRIVLFGGTGGATPEGDTWEWDGAEWLRTASDGPPPRSGAAMAYDPTSRHIVLFGGLGAGVSGDDGGAAATPLADTWEYYVVGEACASADTCASSSCVDGVCCDQASCGDCAACNTLEKPGVCAPCAKCDAATKKCTP